MKKKYVGVLIVLLVAMGITLVSAVADSSNGNKLNGIQAGNWIQLDNGFCNDMKFTISSTSVANFYNLNGYEYGCGYKDRIATGTLWLDGSNIRIAYNVDTSTSTATPYLGTASGVINQATMTGTGNYSWHYDSYHYGSYTYTMSVHSGPMSVGEVAIVGSDSANT